MVPARPMATRAKARIQRRRVSVPIWRVEVTETLNAKRHNSRVVAPARSGAQVRKFQLNLACAGVTAEPEIGCRDLRIQRSYPASLNSTQCLDYDRPNRSSITELGLS